MATTRKPARKPAVVATIDKSEALALVKSGEVSRPNKFRRPCHLCGEVVDAGAGVLGGDKESGWWAAHEGGKCMAPKRAPRKRATVRKTDDFDEMVAAQIAESASKKKTAAETESAAMVDEPKVPVRGGKRNSTMAAAKKTVARRTTRKAAPAPTAKRPVKRTAPKKVEPNKPTESASTEEPENDGVDATISEIVAQVKTFIANGVLDTVLGEIDDAITARLDAVEPPKPAAKKTTARKTTTPKTTAQKVAPVKRAAKPSESASASTPDGKVEVVKVPRPAKGRDYKVNPNLKNKYAGLKITFKSYVTGSENKKASVTIRQEFEGKPEGSRLVVPVSSIVQDN